MNLDPDIKASISGIRGHWPDQLNAETTAGLAQAFVNTITTKSRPILIGHDARPHSTKIHHIIISVLRGNNLEVIDIGLAPLPTTGIVTKKYDCAAGINVTASHNPPPYHGIKFLDENGEFIDNHWLNQLLHNFDQLDPADISIDKEFDFEASFSRKAYDNHLALYSYDTIKQKVAVDAVINSGSIIIPELLDRLGCEVIEIACDPSDEPNREYEPNVKNLAKTADTIKNLDCDFGIAVDPDADRLVLISPTKGVISEEYTLALAVWNMLLENYQGDIVVNQSTSRLVDWVAENFDRKVLRSAVGEQNVVSMMRTYSSIIGGEGNGGVIDGSRHYSRDSLSGIYHVLKLLTKKKMNLDEVIDTMPQLIMSKEKLAIKGLDVNKIYTELQSNLESILNLAEVDVEDGLRLVFKNNSWIHIRPSNTEPILRIIGESKEIKTIKAIFDTVNNLLQPKQ